MLNPDCDDYFASGIIDNKLITNLNWGKLLRKIPIVRVKSHLITIDYPSTGRAVAMTCGGAGPAGNAAPSDATRFRGRAAVRWTFRRGDGVAAACVCV